MLYTAIILSFTISRTTLMGFEIQTQLISNWNLQVKTSQNNILYAMPIKNAFSKPEYDSHHLLKHFVEGVGKWW